MRNKSEFYTRERVVLPRRIFSGTFQLGTRGVGVGREISIGKGSGPMKKKNVIAGTIHPL
jgi:hypothetical protein